MKENNSDLIVNWRLVGCLKNFTTAVNNIVNIVTKKLIYKILIYLKFSPASTKNKACPMDGRFWKTTTRWLWFFIPHYYQRWDVVSLLQYSNKTTVNTVPTLYDETENLYGYCFLETKEKIEDFLWGLLGHLPSSFDITPGSFFFIFLYF